MAGQTNCVGTMSLFDASGEGNLPRVKELLDRGADADKARTDNGATPCLIAAEKGHAKVVRILLDAGCTVDQADNRGMTPLYVAAQEGHHEIVSMLLGAGADVNACLPTSNESTILTEACFPSQRSVSPMGY